MSVMDIKTPRDFDFTSSNMAKEWEDWFQIFGYYIQAAKRMKDSEEEKIAFLLNQLGSQGVHIFNTFESKDEKKLSKFDYVIVAFTDYFQPKKNTLYERYIFNTTELKPGQPILEYLTTLKTLASGCEFHANERDFIIRDRLLSQIKDKTLINRLLEKGGGLTLEEMVTDCKIYLQRKQQVQDMGQDSDISDDDEAGVSKRLTIDEETIDNDDGIRSKRKITKITKRGQKRRRKKSQNKSPGGNEVPGMLLNLGEELERELEVKAKRNHFTAWNVKNMIKAVITDSEVMKMVDFSLEKTTEKPVYELKLTRAKTKELESLGQSTLLNLPSAMPIQSDIEVLIKEELPEDSSDEEYKPKEEMSDDESKASESVLEDDSMLDDDLAADFESPVKTISNQDNVAEEDVENIGQRTRSKFSLSETPLETIEQAFIPPDITTDMYNTHCDNVDWLNFLKEFMQPLDCSQPEPLDDDDPEYNVMIDEEQEATDKEELRHDRAVKVTKKELNDLMSELAEYTQMLSSDEEEEICATEEPPSLQKEAEETIPEVETTYGITELQYHLLKQQLQQHVQLLLQSYLLLVGHPAINEDYAIECKERLNELDNFRKMNLQSCFNVLNLDSSMKLMEDWTHFLSNPVNFCNVKKFLQNELEKVKSYKSNKVRYRPQLPEELIKLCLLSDAFLYPLFLPSAGFSEFAIHSPVRFTFHEDQLVAMGLEEFSEFLKCDVENNQDLNEVVSYIQEYLIPVKSVQQIICHVRKLQADVSQNPIKVFFQSKNAPQVQHYVVTHTALKVLKDSSHELLPESWLKCVNEMK